LRVDFVASPLPDSLQECPHPRQIFSVIRIDCGSEKVIREKIHRVRETNNVIPGCGGTIILSDAQATGEKYFDRRGLLRQWRR